MKPLPFRTATMLAPMEGVGHPLFREAVAAQGGIGIVCTEFVRVSRAPISEAALAREVVKVEGLPLSVQVMGNDADKMADAAAVVARAGADVVDVNLGCPMPRVVRKGVGAAMLKDLVLLERVLREMREKTPVPLSAKIRAGFDDVENVLAIARTVERAGVDYLVVHPRRRADFYSGVADWRIIRTLVSALSIPVVGNGDVWYAQDALRMREETGCAAVMIGRPAIRNPFIFRQIEALTDGREAFAPSGADVVAYLRFVRARFATGEGATERGVLGKLKEIVRYVLRALPEGESVSRAVLRLETTELLLEACETALHALEPAQLDLCADGHLALERSGSALAASHAA